jgi:hypothetical protein
MGATDEKSCNNAGCNREWDRDPALEVDCPTCQAEAGTLCRRPSGHTVWNSDWNLPKGIHPDRDAKALDDGCYGECPLGKCPESLEELSPESPYKNVEETETNQKAIGDY